jgi:hypothetical protein
MNYDQVLKHLMTMSEIPLNQEDENFKRIIPLMFAYAENRIYRELEFLATTTKTTGALVADVADVALPQKVLVLRALNVFAMSPSLWAIGGNRKNVLTKYTPERISPEAMDMFWPQNELLPGLSRMPRQYAVIGNESVGVPPFTQVLSYTIRLMPVPDQNYAVEFLGVIRPETLSPTNTVTYLSETYPELLCAACMVFIAGYQRDFGAQAEDPQKAMSWNGVYESLRASVMLEAGRMKGTLLTAGNPGRGAA